MNGEGLAKLAGLGSYARTRGFGEDVAQGDYHIVGTQVILRSGPSASDKVIGALENGEGVYAFGDTETDVEHMVGPNGEAELNDGTSPGIEYVHVGTQTHGPGWVAINFISPGAGAPVNPNPQPQPTPTPTPTPQPTPAPMTKSDKVSTFLVGGLIGVAVLGGVVLLVHHAKKQPRRLAHA